MTDDPVIAISSIFAIALVAAIVLYFALTILEIIERKKK